MSDQQIDPGAQEQLSSPVTLHRETLIERLGISPPLFALISLIIIFILYQIVGGVLTLLLFGMTPDTAHVGGFRLATALGELLLIFVPTLILVRAATWSPAEYLRLRRPGWKVILVPLVGIFSLEQMLQVYLVFQDKIPFPDALQKDLQNFKELIDQLYKQLAGSSTPGEFWIVVLVVGLVPAIAEEFLFRGLVQRSLERSFTPLGSALFTGVLFGLYHLNPFTLVPLAVLGAYLGFVAMRANSLWVSVATHFYNNFFACIALYWQIKDDYVVTGNANDMSLGGLLLTFWFFGIIFLLSTLYFIRITREPVPEEFSGDDSSGILQ
jgi:uncharacterized protein